MAVGGGGTDRIYVCWHPGCGDPCYRDDVRGRQLQADGWIDHGDHHSQQEPVGIWLFEVHHAVGRAGGIRAAHHAEYVLDLPVVLVRDCVLHLGKEDEGLDEEQRSSSNVVD